MSSPPIGNSPRDPYEAYRVEAIERDRHAKENQKREPPPEEPKEKQWIVFAYVLTLLNKILEYFQWIPEKGAAAAEQSSIRDHLLQLKAAFEIMKKEDVCQDIPFLNRLSRLWQNVLEEALRLKRDSFLAKEMKHLIDEIQHYPQRQTHSLGYYLAEYAGQKWLPFPFMEMIQKIHAEHLQSHRQSALAGWTRRIDVLLLHLKSDEQV